jgi:anthranilate phosphoribosyltransferase
MTNEIQKLIEKISAKHDLSQDESARLFQVIMNGGATPAQIAAALLALKTKGETVDEITGAVNLLRSKMTKLSIPDTTRKSAIDVCGHRRR